MLTTSLAFREYVGRSSKLATRATLSFADGTERELSGDDFAFGGLSVDSATSAGGTFDVGAAVASTCTATLANYDQRFDGCDFTGAVLVPYVGAPLDDGTTEWLRLGTFNVEQPDSYGATIQLVCHDNLRHLGRTYAAAHTVYPATLATIVRDACAVCGLLVLTDDFPNASYVVGMRPDDAGLTCLQVVSYAAQCAGCFVTCDPFGRVSLRWYDTAAYESEAWLDGGTLDGPDVPYADGDDADGGWFMGGGDSFDGGYVGDASRAHLHAMRSLTTSTDDVVVTGIKATARDEVLEDGTIGNPGETATFGTTGYVLTLEDNPLVQYGQAAAVAAQVGRSVVGMRFRPFNATGLASPAWQAGDPVVITDQRMRTYRSWLTSYTWHAGGTATLACDADTPARNGAARGASVTRALVAARNAIRAERTARESAIETVMYEIAGSAGLHMTADPQPDGSTIYYMHDRPTRAESTVIWRMSADSFTVSMDGGQTYPYGLDATGMAILNRIYAIGIDAGHIDAGRMAVGGTADDPLFLADFDTGQVLLRSADGSTYIDLLRGQINLSGASTLSGSTTVADLLGVVDDNVIAVDVEYCDSTSSTTAPADDDPGWGTVAPVWRAGWYIWQRTSVTRPTGITRGAATCISGRDGSSVGIASTAVEYAASGSGTETPAATAFSPTIPEVVAGEWLWTRTTVSYTDGTSTTSYSVAGNGSEGRNLLRRTGSVTASDLACTRSTVPETGIIRLTPTTSASYAKFKVDYLDYADHGEGAYTVSFDARLAPVASDYTNVNVGIYLGYSIASRTGSVFSSSYDRYCPLKVLSTELTSEWARCSVTVNVPGDLTTGKATALVAGSQLSVELAVGGSRKPVEVRNVKLERGARASAWTMAPEDLVGIAYTSTTYGTSASATAEPTTWQQTAPTVTKGQWLWIRTVTTYTDGTSTTATTKSYAGTDGTDGTSVTILGSYSTLAELQAAHPTGSTGDSYIVAGDLYVWDGTAWADVGQIQGPRGRDGTSVEVSSSTKADGVTTVTLSDGTVLTIADGSDGEDGKAGPDGRNLLLGTSAAKSVTLSDATSDAHTGYYGESGYGKTVTAGNRDDLLAVSFDWSVEVPEGGTPGGEAWLQIEGTIINGVVDAGGYGGSYDRRSIDLSGGSGHYWCTFRLTTAQSAFVQQRMRLRARGTSDNPACPGEVVTISNLKMERTDTVPTGWSLAPEDLVGIGSSTIEYATSASEEDEPETWQSEAPALAKGQWLWTRVTTTYTDGSTTVALSKAYAGADGTGMSSIASEYLLTEMDGSTEELTPDGSEPEWTTAQPEWEEGYHIWTRSRVTWDDGTVTCTEPLLADALNALGLGVAAAQQTADEAQETANNAQASADDAATKATSFIRQDPAVGSILIGDMVGEVTRRLLRMTATSIDFMNDGVVVASFGDTVRLGLQDSYHMETTAGDISFYEGATRRAYLSGDRLSVANAEAEGAFYIGEYALRTGGNGYFTIVKRA